MPNYGFKKSYADPSPNIMRRVLGIPAMSDDTTTEWPELANAWAGREIELPQEAAATKAVRPMNSFEKFISGDAAGLTWPWKTIAVNRDVVENEGMDLGDVLAHELIHVGQNSLGGLLRNAYSNVSKKYGNQPREIEAFEYGSSRPVRTKDIHLKGK